MKRRSFIAVTVMLLVSAFAEPIRRIEVESSNLKSVGFDPKAKMLEIEFLNSGVYRYFDVPESVHTALMKAESKGKFFQTNIRNKFRFERTSSGR